MSLLSFQNVSMSFAQRDIFRNATFDVAKGDRIGLIGSNGSGKTTLFKLICGEHSCTQGNIVKASDTTVGFVEQHACQGSDRNVYNEILTVFSFLEEMEKQLEEVHRKIELTDGKVPEYLEQQAVLTEKYNSLGGLTYKARAHSCLKGLGFTEQQERLPVSALSGGQRTKLSLGKLLLSSPDIMLLDEPTNHLDMESVEWLEDFVSKYQGTLIIISHDRYFLDATTTRTIEITNKRVYCGKGSYSTYMKNKAVRLETEKREYEKAMIEIKRIEKMIEQQKQFNQERNYITIASKEKQIQRIRESMPEAPQNERTVKLRFGEVLRSGDEVLIAQSLAKAYGPKILFRNVDLKIFRGEKVFLLGPNGCGKSTLLSIIMKKTQTDCGLSRFGHEVQVGFFEQTQQSLMSSKTILQEVYDRFPRMTIPEIRGYLGVFNFKDDDIEKLMSDLSGGERARIALLCLILQKPNFLILDEPTNHLDVSSREVLEEALSEYEGTILCVSHDRYFVNKLATRIISFNGAEVSSFDGNYDEYINMLKNIPSQTTKAEKKPNEYKLRKEMASLERKRTARIAKIEELLAEIEEKKAETQGLLENPEVSADYEKILELTNLLSELNEKSEELEMEWLELSEG